MKKIPPDKWKHFFVGLALGATFQYYLLHFFPLYHVCTIVATLVIVIMICYGFELFSKITGIGHYEILDAVAGTIGGIVGMTIVLISKAFLLY